jgi:nucleotide-binding universal stress UspA family protein
MIAMGSHARPALIKFFFGTATEETLSNSAVPVFLFH